MLTKEQRTGLAALVVDDDPISRHMNMALLQQLGIGDIAQAASGEEALRQVVEVEPDFILCDIFMDPMNGIEFVQFLRGLSFPDLRDIPVIFLTSASNLETVSEAMSLHVSGYLVKPVTKDNLAQQLDAIFS